MSLAEQVRRAGVVGAGGAGFPAHIKLAGRADTVIANGAECEPLLHKDAAVMERSAAEVVAGVALSMDAVGARRGVVAVKRKNRHAVEVMSEACRGSSVELVLLGDYYPAGDEYDLVYTVTGRLIPAAGLPLDVGCVVNNVETLINVARAAAGTAVVEKTITLAGAVREPQTLTVPLGTSWRECIEHAGGVIGGSTVLFLGGLMMGVPVRDFDLPVIKTSTGVVVLPEDHPVVRRRMTPAEAQAGIGKSACDQCRYCTEFCPRYLLGYAVEPHRVMRGLGFTATGSARWNEWATLCCSCGLCTLYACPEDLFPAEACHEAKVDLRRRGIRWSGPSPAVAHPLREGRRVPIQRLMRRLGVEEYDAPAAWREWRRPAGRLVLPLRQHAGEPAKAVVRAGERVGKGQLIADVPPGTLGARLHAPSAGLVATVDERTLVLEATS